MLDNDLVRSAKETLISRGLLRSIDRQQPWVPEQIDRSWRRSISVGATRATNAFQFVNEFDNESELSRAARPVLDRLADTLQDMGTAIFLADRSGQIVARRVAGVRERARFDNANAAEGFVFSEESIGTNGLGTPIQEGAAVFVRGAEHFNEALEGLACAGVGIRHPVTGRVIGSLSLAAPATAAEMMMLAMTREGAQQIVDNLRAGTASRELALGRNYQRHRAKGPVIVLNSDTVMTNVTGLSFLNVEMHARLWESLLERDWDRGPHELVLDFQSLQARVLAHRLDDHEDAAFAVEIIDRQHVRPNGRPPRLSTAANQYVRDVQRMAERSSSVLAVTGPGGAGKWYVVREWLCAERHDDPLVLEGGGLPESWRRDAGEAMTAGRTVVLRRLEDLDVTRLSALKILAGSVTPGRLVVTADLDRCTEPARRIVSQIAVVVEVPALVARSQELPSLVQALLAEIEPDRRPVLSAAAMQVLLRWNWPGNVAELRKVVLRLAAELPGKAVCPDHLPRRMRDAASRRSFTRIEAAERSEIVSALRQTGGNRSKAATLLGIGRTTLYRRLAALGIDDEALLT
ncbi:sigma-54-dependent Fis family transcriptional regulator [Nocardia nova]|uniref:sigma-54-dependent Fis family transcriptional regulator n=1 Tax=Nocardia nova TaxID=37330 RepID=UPI0033DCE2B8